MKIVKQDWDFLRPFEAPFLLSKIEQAGRLCYKSEDKITEVSAKEFVKKAINIGHHSIIEHGAISVKIITDRGVTHELVRHRLASYSQESTRYCNYSKDKFGNQVTFIVPVRFVKLHRELGRCLEPADIHSPAFLEKYGGLWKRYINWYTGLTEAEHRYISALNLGESPQEARDLLPNSLKTEIVMTANPREWRHVFTLRTSPKAHPQIRALMIDMLAEFKCQFPILFDDILVKGVQ